MTPGKGPAIMTARRLLNPQRALVWLIVLVAVMNFIIVFFLTPWPRTLIQQGDLTIYVDPDYALPAMKMRIAVALLIGAFALPFSGLKTRLLSVLALTGALVQYGLWAAVTYRWIRNAASYGDPPIKYHFFLHDASWLDVLIIIAVVITLVWQIKACIKLISMRRRKVI